MALLFPHKRRIGPMSSAAPVSIRMALPADVDALFDLEMFCFDGDRLSRRSLAYFVRHAHADVMVALLDGNVIGYAIVMYRRGTRLARLYSLAVHPAARGLGVGKRLLAQSEANATDKDCGFIRLEVSIENEAAIALYRASGYVARTRLKAYYENGSDGWRMEKALSRHANPPARPTPYFEQTTDFTCGPASLMMALDVLQPDYQPSEQEELQIWREATTIFMTSGHGGCSPYGLALSAVKRGVSVSLITDHDGVPFVDGVRHERKKQVIEKVHADFLKQLRKTSVSLLYQPMALEPVLAALKQGKVLLCLISTWRLNRNKAPHWVVLNGADDRFVYLTDPDFDKEQGQSPTDYVDVPVTHQEYLAMACYGKQKLHAALVLG